MFSIILYRIPALIARNFGEISVDQFIFHLTADVAGVPLALQKRIFVDLLIKPVIAGGLLFLAMRWMPKNLLGVGKKIIYGVSFFLASAGVLATASVINIREAVDTIVHREDDFDWIKKWYAVPNIESHPKKNRNLIWIYVESLEKRRILPDSYLKKLSDNNFSPKTFQILPGTQWTLAGMVASQCGVPLMPVGMYAANNFEQIKRPLANAACIGDVLREQGFHNEFIAGAAHTFSGKGTFLKNHGFSKLTGKVELSEFYPASDYPGDWWGYPDRTVFDFSKKRLVDLSKKTDPFFLNILTLDTHGPEGINTSACKAAGYKNTVDDIFQCSIKEVEYFIKWLNESGIAKNSVIVVSGDHPFMEPGSDPHSLNRMKNPFSDEPVKNKDVFTLIIAPDAAPHHPPVMNHFDFFPTVIGALNFGLIDNSAGLGRNLYVSESLSQREDQALLKRRLRSRSEGYLKIWRPTEHVDD